MIYEIAPGCLIETSQVLHEDELQEAKDAFASETASLEDIAGQFGGQVHTPLPRERRTELVTIPREDYIELLRAAGRLEE